jgi:4-hydroxybenzoate polyprenyltransferase
MTTAVLGWTVLAAILAVAVALFVGAIIVMVCRDLFDVYRDRRSRRRRDRGAARGEQSTWDRY